MDFCTPHFGKFLNELTIDDIKSYFLEERIETNQLEFKSINPAGNISEKFTGIKRSVCAFLNSGGGLLIGVRQKGKR